MQAGLLVREIMDELEYFVYSCSRNNAEIWGWMRKIVRRMSRMG